MPTNDYYDSSGAPSTGSPINSSALRTEFDAIEAGFIKVLNPSTNAGKIVAINAGGTAQEAAAETGTGAVVRAVSPTFTGIPAAPTAAAGTNTTQLATTAHVFAERATALTLTNKTLTTPVINGLTTGTGVATANTASTLVARDAIGNFAAGVITASLTGTATTATTANALKSATTDVGVSAATAPTAGQVLTATSGTAATWQSTSSGPLNGIQAASGNQAGTANADFNVRWNWAKTTNTTVAFEFGESAAATGGTLTAGVPNQVGLKLSTLATSTMSPLSVYSRGVHAFSVSPTAPQIMVNWGTEVLPGYAFANAVSTGLYLVSATNLTATLDGRAHLSVQSNGTTAKIAFSAQGNSGVNAFGNWGVFEIGSRDTALAEMSLVHGSSGTTPVRIQGRKSRGEAATPSVITTGDDILTLSGFGYVGVTNTYQEAATLLFDSSGAVSDVVGGLGGVMRFLTRTPAAAALVERMTIDNSATAGETGLLLSVAGAAPIRVSVGANDSGGAGFRLLRVPN